MTQKDDKLAKTAAGSSAAHSEENTKDESFARVADVANHMIERHGKDFAMGTLLIAARFIAEGKPLTTMNPDTAGQ